MKCPECKTGELIEQTPPEPPELWQTGLTRVEKCDYCGETFFYYQVLKAAAPTTNQNGD